MRLGPAGSFSDQVGVRIRKLPQHDVHVTYAQ